MSASTEAGRSDLLLENLKLLGWIDNELRQLGEYVRFVADAVRVPLADKYPIFGKDAFRTGTGVHAAAIIKARKREVNCSPIAFTRAFLRECSVFSRSLMSRSNAIYWLAANEFQRDQVHQPGAD